MWVCVCVCVSNTNYTDLVANFIYSIQYLYQLHCLRMNLTPKKVLQNIFRLVSCVTDWQTYKNITYKINFNYWIFAPDLLRGEWCQFLTDVSGTTCRYRVGLISFFFTETPVRKLLILAAYNNSEERSSQLLRCGSLKSHITNIWTIKFFLCFRKCHFLIA